MIGKAGPSPSDGTMPIVPLSSREQTCCRVGSEYRGPVHIVLPKERGTRRIEDSRDLRRLYTATSKQRKALSTSTFCPIPKNAHRPCLSLSLLGLCATSMSKNNGKAPDGREHRRVEKKKETQSTPQPFFRLPGPFGTKFQRDDDNRRLDRRDMPKQNSPLPCVYLSLRDSELSNVFVRDSLSRDLLVFSKDPTE